MNPRLGLLTLVGLAACSTQRFPGPMPAAVRPLPEGEIPEPPYGPQEVVVYRLSDPVLVRRAGEASAYPLPVYDKRERVRSGASVQCAAGGRCELLWPQDASSVLLFDEGWVDLGEPSRDEPIVTFRRVTRARLTLTPGRSVVLMGGGVLRGDGEDKSGPFLVERTRDDLVTLTNQSKRACTVAFRDVEIELSPGELLRLPLLDAGGEPAPRDPAERVVDVAGREVRVVGDVRVAEGDVVAGPDGGSIEDGGVTVRLEAGERAVLEVFSAPVPVPGPEAGEETPGEAPEAGAPAGAEAAEAVEGGEEPPAEPGAEEPADPPAEDPGEPPSEEPDPAAQPPAEGAEPPPADSPATAQAFPARVPIPPVPRRAGPAAPSPDPA